MDLIKIFHPQNVLKTNCEPETDWGQFEGCTAI